MKLSLSLLPERLSVCRLPPDSGLGPLPSDGLLRSVTRTARELSLVVPVDEAPADADCQGPFRALEVAGPLDFALTGVLASLAAPLAAAGIPIFVLSTYDTDYLLVREKALGLTVDVLRQAGHKIR